MTIVIELMEPALAQTADDLAALGSEQIRQVSLRLTSAEERTHGVETKADPATTNLGELVAFAREVQTEPTTVELWYQGRSEAFTF